MLYERLLNAVEGKSPYTAAYLGMRFARAMKRKVIDF
jgi:hypothetical protein